ncbi:hypothetical protein [Methylocystis sp.]|uniref:hypothetical protein n=1 Tax=Methylocystis sp. TaxID=1911079 RepID=UPI0025ED0AD4|nr:hypothetical protein [Methylocystis sp.]
MNDRVQLPEKYEHTQSTSLKMTKSVERLADTSDMAQPAIGIIDSVHENQEPMVHQGQLWTIDPIEKTISSIIFVEPNDDIEDAFGTRLGYKGCYDKGRRRTLNDEDDAVPCISFVICQGTLYLEEELPIDHPLRQFPHLGRGWNFERNCLIRRST